MKTKNKGISLIETIVTLSIFSVASVLVANFVIQAYKANLFANDQAEAINHARTGIDTMVKELREASPGDNGAYPIATAESQNLIFYGDIDLDEVVEKVRYTLEGTNLIKGVTKPAGFPAVYSGTETTTIISKYVRNDTEPIFYYYNGDYPTDVINNPLAEPININQVRLIKSYLRIDLNPSRAPTNFILIANSQLRNLKDNL